MKNGKALRKHLVDLMEMRGAHVGHARALDGWPAGLRGRPVEGSPYTAWQLLEHMRLSQVDMLDFSRNPDYEVKKFPDDYWPASEAPAGEKAWEQSIADFRGDLAEMVQLVNDPETDLFAEIPWGDGHTILREALQVADHNAYHLGQLVLLRRQLAAW